MFGFGKTAKASNEAVNTITPLVARSRDQLGGIDERDWHSPYMIGYMSMLISLIAKKVTDGSIKDEQLGRAQQDAWAKITGCRHDNIGADICILSSGRNAMFGTGCENALHFMKAFFGENVDLDLTPDDDTQTSDLNLPPDSSFFSANDDQQAPEQQDLYGAGGALGHILWIQYFDDHIE